MSRWTTADTRDVPPPDVAEHVNVEPAVSATTVDGSHPVREVISDSGSVTLQVTETLETYQPLDPAWLMRP